MKKIMSRTTSLLLVLVLMLSVLPVAAFAAEAEEEVAPAAACTHPRFQTYIESDCVNCGANHRNDVRTTYVCPTCGYSYTTTKSTYNSHTIVDKGNNKRGCAYCTYMVP